MGFTLPYLVDFITKWQQKIGGQMDTLPLLNGPRKGHAIRLNAELNSVRDEMYIHI